MSLWIKAAPEDTELFHNAMFVFYRFSESSQLKLHNVCHFKSTSQWLDFFNSCFGMKALLSILKKAKVTEFVVFHCVLKMHFVFFN